MPAGKKEQSNAMLYTLLVFVAFFIVATTFAIIYYLDSEEQKSIAFNAQQKLEEMAKDTEWRKRAALVGTKKERESYFGKMVDYFDQSVSLVVGGAPEDTSAEEKIASVKRKVKQSLDLLAQEPFDIQTIDPNIAGLLNVVEKLKAMVGNLIAENTNLKEQLTDLQTRFSEAHTATQQKEEKLLAEKDEFERKINEIQTSYDALKKLLEQTSEERVQTTMAQLEEQKAKYMEELQEKLQLQAKLIMTEDKMKLALQQLRNIQPQPDKEVPAYNPDGKIILIDDQTQMVHINLGSDDGVYRGLTFSVYNKSMPIPQDGKGKAEIEAFNVGKNIAAARITVSKKTNPIIEGDVVANLIWDRDKINSFVVAGNFDVDGNGNIELDGVERIKQLILKSGGKIADTVSIDTDYLVLGRPPQIPPKPTFEQLENYPMAMQRYKDSVKELTHYKEMVSLSRSLMVPVFNYERFLYFIGYKSQSSQPGAF